jgi:2-octaprenyl-6-methoxyphenol hydroxylase
MLAPNSSRYDVAVIGAGPSGLVAGLACAALGLRTTIIGPVSNPQDGRSAALFQSSIQFLKNLNVWNALESHVAPLSAIRLVDATGALIRAPEVTFHAHEIGWDAFGYAVPNGALTSTLEAAVAASTITRLTTPAVTAFDLTGGTALITTSEGQQVCAQLIAAADGRSSPSRAAADIECATWAYDQAAVVTSFEHSRPHGAISTEFHRRSGPLTVVPGPGNTSSLVWVETPDEAETIAKLSDQAFAKVLQKHLGGLLGNLTQFSPRRVFPLAGQTAKSLGKNRVALIGEAGHVMPPIGAQGLNLSFRDAAVLATLAAEACKASQDIGGQSLLTRYDTARRADVTGRIWTIDLLNKSLLSDLLPVHLMRGAGLVAMRSLGPLRRRLMQEGMSPDYALPSLMREPTETVGSVQH